MKFLPVLQGALCAGALLLGLGASRQAQAATFTVTNNNDSGAGSLRQAVINANNAASDDTVIFDVPGAQRIGIGFTLGEIRIANNGKLTINGSTTSPVTLAGNRRDVYGRFFSISPGANVTLNKLTLINGFSQFGAAIFNNNATLTLNECILSFNMAERLAGRVGTNNGGAIYNTGTLVVNNSTLDANQCWQGNGGAIYNLGAVTINGSQFFNNGAISAEGGAICNRSGSTLVVNNTTFWVNSGGFGGSISNSFSTSTINGCTFNGNGVGADSSVVGTGSGGALYNLGGKLTVSNSTFASNGGDKGGAIYNDSNVRGAVAGSSLIIKNCTLSLNAAPLGTGGGIYNQSGSFTLDNSIVAGNTTDNNGTREGPAPNIYGVVTAGDYNLIGDATDATLSGSHNLIGQSAQLGPLENNGGPTDTFALLAGSPAIDAGNSTLTSDQRGQVRPRDLVGVPNAEGSNGSDIGAFELGEVSQSGPNFVVNTTDDHADGVCGPTDCTLSDAIRAANSNPDASTITFDETVFATKQTINLKKELPMILTDMTVSGPTGVGAGVTLSLLSDYPSVILVVAGDAVSFANLTFAAPRSIGLIALGDTVTVNSCTFTRCATGIRNGGSSNRSPRLTVNNSTFYQNSNAGFMNDQSGDNVASFNSCTFNGNSTGIIVQGDTVNLSNSIVAGNGTNINNLRGTLNESRNITTGNAGLSPLGLRDNGGPTQTIALLAGSPAINTGATNLTTDQRGTSRDGQPDVGAFEYFPSEPRVESLSPQNASDKVGAKRTFSVTVSDPTGASDIKEVWLLINTRLNWSEGAALIYVPSTQSPTNGLLYLRKGESFLPPVQVGAGARGGLDNGVVSILAPEVKVTTSGNNLTLSVPLIVRDGLVGQNQVFARAVDRADSTDPAALAGDEGYRRFGTYTVAPQFSSGTNSAPTLSRLNPSVTTTTLDSSGVAGAVQTFTFAVKDDNGTGDIESLWFMAGKERSWTRSATFIYVPRSRRLFLRSDDGNSFLGGAIIGTSGILENSQVRLDLSKVKTTIYPDGKTLALSLPLQAKRGLLGQNKVWLRTQDTLGATAPNGDDQGYVQSGNWNVGQSTTTRSAPSASAGGS